MSKPADNLKRVPKSNDATSAPTLKDIGLTKPICGAKTRKGTPCQRKLLLKGGKCPNHGGMSTGPKTDKGIAATSANLRLTPNWKKRLGGLDGSGA